MDKSHKVIVVVGPTASGKSDFAVQLAKKVNGEIISADSRQIYRGLDIGTGKITESEMQGVPHHMLDIRNPGDTFSVAEYKEEGEKIIKDIFARNKTPIICGGTGQYIDSLIYSTELPKVKENAELRKHLETLSTDELYSLLTEKDVRRGKEIDKHNKVRLIRALEIIDALGYVPQQEAPELRYDTEIYLLSPTRELLRERIMKRLIKRIDEGMIDEVKKLKEQNFSQLHMKKFGLEYDVISEYLQGTYSKEEMIEKLYYKIVHYAKRQQTWNKKYEPVAKIIEVKQ